MPKTTSFALGDKLETFVSERVASGEYASASEVMREALRIMKRRVERRAYEARLVSEGLASGVAPVSHDDAWEQIRRKRAARGSRG